MRFSFLGPSGKDSEDRNPEARDSQNRKLHGALNQTPLKLHVKRAGNDGLGTNKHGKHIAAHGFFTI